MNHGRIIFAQILDGIDPKEFGRCASQFPTIRQTHALSAYDHFAAMIFAQLTHRESLRDIETCINARRNLLYHSGIRGNVTRTNLSYANEHRDARVFAAVAAVLMRRARRLYAGVKDALELDGELFAIDSTLIDLSLAICPWARWQGTQAAVKLNVLLEVANELPGFCTLVEGKDSDMNFLDDLIFIAGCYYVMDRGYLDFKRLYRITRACAWFVTRLKSNICFYVVETRPVAGQEGVRCDQTIQLNGNKARAGYPERLRRIHYYDKESGNELVFVTNNFTLPALVIAQIYKRRWEIELFFRWIKMHLKLRGFYSTTKNGVAVQIWTAICAYLLVAIAQREMALPGSLHRTLQLISTCAFEQIPLHQLVMKNATRIEPVDIPNQLIFNGI